MENSDKTNNQVKVEILDQGPIKVTGKIVLKDLKRYKEESLKEVFLCGCGKSSNKPYCDDSHKQ
jgi:CDGSH-type Zn-finger protein